MSGTLGVIALSLVLGGLLYFWLKMLVLALTERDVATRILWSLVILVGSLLGAVLYAFVRQPQRIAESQDESDEDVLQELREELASRH